MRAFIKIVFQIFPVFQIVQKTPENYRPCLDYHLTQFGDSMSCSSKDILKDASYLMY